ncbi:MAG: DEAD/DEAH box helicase [Actinobacteria bacterium]|nr:MAG: DEAD/DEAH box helicase [Actinomycetota bacterium]TML69156.1 MAG: DEAD/DEAH box helicase [Actinomycetota bacterium]
MNNLSQQSFRELGVSSRVIDVLAAGSIHHPFPIQARVLPDALAGLDVLAKSPTGSGKTLAFGIPIVQRTSVGDRRPSALVLVPTRELARQVADDVRAIASVRDLTVAVVHGGAPLRAQADRARSAHVVVATPGRLHDLLERRLLDLRAVRILVLDEADRMLDMGFKPQVDRIVKRLPSNRQTMFFSATLDGEVGLLAREYTTAASRYEADLPGGRDTGEITHRFIAVQPDTKVETLVEHIRAADGLTLVFVRTKRGAAALVRKLARHDVRAEAMHGDLTQPARQRALARFESGKVRVLVATDVAARGLDIDDVAHVINYDPPDEDKGYVHRTGRTGRAGRSGSAVTFVLPDQQAETSRVANRLGHRQQFEQAGLQTARPRLLYTSRRGRRSKW